VIAIGGGVYEAEFVVTRSGQYDLQVSRRRGRGLPWLLATLAMATLAMATLAMATLAMATLAMATLAMATLGSTYLLGEPR
jgi:hypothetical protein